MACMLARTRGAGAHVVGPGAGALATRRLKIQLVRARYFARADEIHY